jgi:hypothetical protein
VAHDLSKVVFLVSLARQRYIADVVPDCSDMSGGFLRSHYTMVHYYTTRKIVIRCALSETFHIEQLKYLLAVVQDLNHY